MTTRPYVRFFLAILTVTLIPVTVNATPQFARKYRVDCSSCHSAPPRLNERGLRFVASGYRFEAAEPSRIADLVGSKKALFTGLFDGTSDEVTFDRSGSFLARIERIVTPAISPGPARAEDVRVSEDDGAEREIEAVVAAGDESSDVASAAGPGTEPMPSATEIQRLVSRLTVQRTASGGLVIEAPPDTASTLAALFSGMAQLLQAAAAPPGAILGDTPPSRKTRPAEKPRSR